MTKDDYMQLSKERLAELLVERDVEDKLKNIGYTLPINTLPCYAPDGICTNPQRDCVGCPKHYYPGRYTTFTSSGTDNTINDKKD